MDAVCVDPSAPVVPCFVCGRPVYTCERSEPVKGLGGNDYRCPVHPDGSQIKARLIFPLDLREVDAWVCQGRCYETWSLIASFVDIVHEASIAADPRDALLDEALDWLDDAPGAVLASPSIR